LVTLKKVVKQNTLGFHRNLINIRLTIPGVAFGFCRSLKLEEFF